MEGEISSLLGRLPGEIILRESLHRIGRVQDQGGNGSADDILALLTVSRMPLQLNSADTSLGILQYDHSNHGCILGIDLVDLNLGKELSVAILLVIAGLSLILVDDDLSALAFLHYGSGNGSTVNG